MSETLNFFRRCDIKIEIERLWILFQISPCKLFKTPSHALYFQFLMSDFRWIIFSNQIWLNKKNINIKIINKIRK